RITRKRCGSRRPPWPTRPAFRSSGPVARAAPQSGSLLRSPLVVEELLVFGRALQGGGRGLALDGGGHRIEVPRADLTLMLDRGESAVGSGELGLLQLDEGAHLVARIAVGQVEHRVVQRMEAGQRDELELVAHCAQLALELGD